MKETQYNHKSKRLCKNVVFLSEKENVCRQFFSLLDQNILEQSSHVLVHENDQLECSSRSKNMTSNLHLFFRPDSKTFPSWLSENQT